MKIILYLLLISFSIGVYNPAYAEIGEFRNKIREAIKERKTGESDKNLSEIDEPITKSGKYIFSIQQGGLPRKYIVYVPIGYNPQIASPLLMAFHGGGGDMNYMARDEYYGLISKSNKEKFIVIFPSGYSKFKSGKLATWNAGKCCGDARDKKINDIEFISNILSNVSHQMNIDKTRIFATGMSNGGMISYSIACELPNIFRAIAAVAGTDNNISCSHKTSISILHIHALNDTHVLFYGGAGKNSFRDTSKVTDFISVPDTIKKWVGYNQCNTEPKRILSVSGAYCDLYDACNENSQVQLCVTTTGGHSWPGGYKPRGEETSKAISANDVMWNFFKNQK